MRLHHLSYRNLWTVTAAVSLSLLLGACGSQTPTTAQDAAAATPAAQTPGQPTSEQTQGLQPLALPNADAVSSGVVRTASGSLEIFVRGTDNQIYHRWQPTPGGTWQSWASLGGDMRSEPVALAARDGKLALFALGNDGALWTARQDTNTQTGWTAWTRLGGSFAAAPSVARNPEGHLEAFVRGTDGALWHTWEQADGTWATPASLGGTLASDPAVAPNSQGRLEVVALAKDGNLYAMHQQSGTMTGWSDWSKVGSSFAGAPVVARNADGLLSVVSRKADNTLGEIRAQGSGWAAVRGLGGAFTGDPALVATASGRLAMAARTTNGAVRLSVQTASGWANWQNLGGSFGSAPVLSRGAGNQLYVFARQADGTVKYRVQDTEGGSWKAWASLEKPVGSAAPAPSNPAPTPTPSVPDNSNVPLASRILSPNNYFVRDMSKVPVDSNSAGMMKKLIDDVNKNTGMAIVNPYQYTASYYLADANTPKQRVGFNDCQNKGFVPSELYSGQAIFVDVPIPADALAADGTDAHLAIYQPSSGKMWELWGAGKKADGSWTACWGGRIDNTAQNPGVYSGATGVSASGLVFPAAMITLDEVRKGSINHAIYMAVDFNTVAVGHVWPAVRDDGSSQTNTPNNVPEGSYLRLDPSVNVDALPLTPLAKMIAKAGQKYGFLVMDKAGVTNFGLEDPRRDMAARGTQVNSWEEVVAPSGVDIWRQLQNFPWDKVSVLQRGYGQP